MIPVNHACNCYTMITNKVIIRVQTYPIDYSTAPQPELRQTIHYPAGHQPVKNLNSIECLYMILKPTVEPLS